MNFSKGEENLMDAQVKAIADAGANVLVTGGKVADMALHYANKYQLMVVRWVPFNGIIHPSMSLTCLSHTHAHAEWGIWQSVILWCACPSRLNSKWDLRRLCKTVGAVALPKMVRFIFLSKKNNRTLVFALDFCWHLPSVCCQTVPTPEEMGHCNSVYLTEVGDTQVVVFKHGELIYSCTTFATSDLDMYFTLFLRLFHIFLIFVCLIWVPEGVGRQILLNSTLTWFTVIVSYREGRGSHFYLGDSRLHRQPDGWHWTSHRWWSKHI